jgi:hypothetical protein
MAGPPSLGLAGRLKAFLGVLADGLQQPVAGLRPVFPATTSDRATRAASSSNTISGSMPSPPQTASTASTVAPPANTASRARSRYGHTDDQDTAAQLQEPAQGAL